MTIAVRISAGKTVKGQLVGWVNNRHPAYAHVAKVMGPICGLEAREAEPRRLPKSNAIAGYPTLISRISLTLDLSFPARARLHGALCA